MKSYNLFFGLILLFLGACTTDDAKVTLSSQKSIISFEVPGLETEINGTEILIFVPPSYEGQFGQNPVIVVSPNASYSVLAGSVSLERTGKIIVTAEDGTTQEYRTTPIFKDGLQEVKIFFSWPRTDTFTETGEYPGKIDESNKVITFNVVKEFLNQENVFAQLKLTTVGELATEPKTDDLIDLSLESITATIDGNPTEYRVEFINTNTSFGLFHLDLLGLQVSGSPAWLLMAEEHEGLTDFSQVFYTLDTENITQLTASTQLELPFGAVISPSLDQPIDFTDDVKFTVTAESGDTREFTVRVIKKKIFFQGEALGGNTVIDRAGSFNRYYSNSKIVSLFLVNEALDRKVACSIGQNDFEPGVESYITYSILDAVVDNEQFRLQVELENGEVITTNESVLIETF